MGMLMVGPFLTGWSATMADFKARCEQATDDADHRAVLVAADSLLRMAQAAGNSYYEAYGHYYQGVLFQETVGMTPSAYRKTILQLAASSED